MKLIFLFALEVAQRWAENYLADRKASKPFRKLKIVRTK
jgi:hypothetical protein